MPCCCAVCAVLCGINLQCRINELHPDYLNARIESCEDEGVSRLSTNMNKANTPSSVSSLVHSTTKITVSAPGKAKLV